MCGTNASCSHTTNSFERSDHIVLEFLVSQIVRAHDYLCKAPPRLAQVYGHVSELIPAQHIAFAMCRAGTNCVHMAKDLCQHRGGLCTSQTCTRARFGETQNYGRFAQLHVHFDLWHLHFLFHTGPPIKRVWDRSDLTQNDGNMSTRENREL